MRHLALIAVLFLAGCAHIPRYKRAPSLAKAQAVAAQGNSEVRDAAREIKEQAKVLEAAGVSSNTIRTLTDRIDYKVSKLLEKK